MVVEGFLEALVERLREGPVRDADPVTYREAPRRDPLRGFGGAGAGLIKPL